MADNIDILAGKLVEAIDTLSAPAAAVAVEAARMAAISCLAGGAINLGVSVGCVVLARWLWKWHRPHHELPGFALGAGAAGIAAVVCLAIVEHLANEVKRAARYQGLQHRQWVARP